ncbi:MAG: aldo/keto reductase [Acholeplasmataceae bacterium]|nr:aldo/keto reductase [Acholeplasmataceae bacterium]
MKNKIYTREKKFKGIEKNPALLGFGCMRLPTLYKNKPDIDEKTALNMMDIAYAHGINYFDTAYPYHDGTSETFIGKALKKYPRSSFYLANKMPSWLIKSGEDAKRIFEEQLKKCQVGYFDFYLCHALNRNNFKAYQIPGVMDFLYEMKNEGKIRHLGFSFHDTPEILDQIIHAYAWDFVQIQCNYLDWSFQDAKTQYEIIETYGVPCIIMEPVRGGLLASLSNPSKEILKKGNSRASIASWAIRYAASKPNVLVVLSGMSNEEQTMDNIQTMSNFKPISNREQCIIDQALKVFLETSTVPCTECRYCMPCPQGVDIPALFKIYNRYHITKSKMDFMREYERFDLDQRANLCIGCGECMTYCPQHIEIPELMKKMSALYHSIKEGN